MFFSKVAMDTCLLAYFNGLSKALAKELIDHLDTIL